MKLLLKIEDQFHRLPWTARIFTAVILGTTVGQAILYTVLSLLE